MKIYLSADIEGTCGIVDWNETELESSVGKYHKEQMTKEVNAACLGANFANATNILVKDAHDSARSINPLSLPENVSILRGWTKDPLVMMAGLDKSFDACVFVGYHSGSSQNGNPLSHTIHCDYDYIKINGNIVSEFTINSYTAAYFKIPIAFVSGDEMLCNEAKKINPNIIAVPVSKGIGNASVSIHPNLALSKIKEGVKNSLTGDLSRHMIKLPEKFEIEIKFRQHYKAYKSSFYPGVKQINSQTIQFKTDDYYEFLRMLFFL
ncbi:M55 family metallopeptidase [[Clostridium] dakarense]|uniref:M55 family metallopeptidase n=1 Tax=Faecalimicrobium dakarense TaxID=1301100 RepID=UPI0004B448B3|nr:M55 family metallopeptidase [[Clostridium] dakarense]